MNDLKDFKPSKKFFAGIDSDGCAFPSMELKHKECFIPNIIKHWGLEPVSMYAREVAEWVNLYSVHRGINRFPALVLVLELLQRRPEVQRAVVKIPDLAPLKQFIALEPALANPALGRAVKSTKDPLLTKTLEWSNAVNQSIQDLVTGLAPFTLVKQSLERLGASADVMVVSATPGEALLREWQEHDMAKYVQLIAGQELGTKQELLKFAQSAGNYGKDHILMVGDAPGDLKAAQTNNALFFPVKPGQEEASWALFYNEAIAKFSNGTYAGAYEEKLIQEFKKLLPDVPPWEQN